MSEKETQLLRSQIERLNDKRFDLEAWKSQTLIFLERIFGKENSKLRMISELKYDYSSWNLRDVSGTGKTTDPVLIQARDILEAAILELEQLGPQQAEEAHEKLWSLLEEELTGKQIKEIKLLLQSDEIKKAEKISKILENLNKENLAMIIARLLSA